MKLTRRFLALLLAFSMSLSLVTPAFASETADEPEAEAVVGETVAVEATEADPAPATEEAVVVEIPVATQAAVNEAAEEEPAVGTAENPADPEWTWNEDYTEASFTITISGGETYYFNVRYSGMEMTVNGTNAVVVNGGFYAPEVHSITNDAAEEQTYTVKVAELPAQPGTMENPAELTDVGATVELAAASQGYYFTYTAPSDGTAVFEFSAEDADGNTLGWMYCVNNLTTYQYGDTQWSDSDPVVNPAEVEVCEGDELQIMVNTYDPDNMWAAPAGTVTVAVSFEYPLGSEMNPISEFYMGMGSIAGEAAAGETVYYSIYGVGNMILTIADAENLAVTVNGQTYTAVDGVITVALPAVMGRMPVSFSVTNKGTETAAFAMAFADPVGSMNNPAELALGDNSVELAAANNGYFYIWTAPAAGTLSLTFGAGEGLGWTYAVNNITAGSYGDTQWSDSDPVVNTAEVSVAMGDKIKIMVNTYDPENPWAAPAGTVTVNATFAKSGLTSDAALMIYDASVPTSNANEAGETVYYQAYGISKLIMTVSNAADLTVTIGENAYTADENGVITLTVPDAGNPRMPVSFSVTNNGETAVAYSISFAYPKGHMENPEEVTVAVDGAETAVTAAVEAGSQGYYYTYTATERGTLSVNIAAVDADAAELGWTYVINNLTTYQYGDTQWSDSDPVVNPAEVDVNIGDQLQIMVCTYDPENMWSAPAGSVTVTLSFEAAYGSATNPIYEFYMGMGTIAGTAPANTAVYYNVYGVGDMILTIADAADLSVNVADNDYAADENGTISVQLPSVMGRQPASFTVTNTGAAEKSFEMSFAYPAGHMNNPAVLTDDGATAAIEAGSQGYYYTYTATERGNLYFYINAADAAGNELGWTYVINNMTTYQYGDTQWSDSDPVMNPGVVSVNVGDQLDIMVNTYDPETPWAAPAGDVSVSLYIEAAEGAKGNPYYTEYTGESITGTAPANTDVYYNINGIGGIGGATLTIENAGDLEIVATYYDSNWVEQTVTGVADENGTVTLELPLYSESDSVTLMIGNNDDEDADFEVQVSFAEGHMQSPEEIELGETTVSLEEDSSYYYYKLTAEKSGYFTVTMNSENWLYAVKTADQNWYDVPELNSVDSATNYTTFYVNEGDVIEIKVNNYNPNWWEGVPEGEVSFTTVITPANYEMVSGKKLTLTFMDPNTGKKVAASKLNWTIEQTFVYRPDGVKVEFDDTAAYATLKNGTLTTKKCGDQVHMVIKATLKTDETVSMTYYVDILPAATKLSIWGMSRDGEYDFPMLWDRYININGYTQEDNLMLLVKGSTNPSNANSKINWKSSNTKVAVIEEYEDGTVAVKPVWDTKNDEYKTGTVTITATAADGSGQKASFKVKFVEWANWVDIYEFNGNALTVGEYGYKKIEAEAGTSVQFKAKADLNKKVKWSEDSNYAKIDNSGKLTIDAKAPHNEWITVYAEVYEGQNYVVDDWVDVLVVNNNPPAATAEIYELTEYVDYMGNVDVSGITSAEDVPVLTYFLETAPNADSAKNAVWKSTKTSVAKVSSVYWHEDAEVWAVDVTPVFKSGECATGTTTITATVDGIKSSVTLTFLRPITEMTIVPTKATVKTGTETVWDPYTWSEDADEPGAYVEKNAIYATAGQSLPLKVVTNDGVTNKGFDWHAYELIGSDGRIIKISNSGTLTIPKDIVEKTVIWVQAYAKDGSNGTEAVVIVEPKATNVHLRTVTTDWDGNEQLTYVSNTTKEWDVSADSNWDGEMDTLQLSALVYPFDASQDVKWTVSNKNIATIDDEGLLTFTGKKFGKLTVTATTKDGSNVKTSFTLNVIRTVQNMNLPAAMVATANKTLNLAKSLTFDPAPTVKNIEWSMIMADLDENGNFQTHPWFGDTLTTDVPAEVATLDAKKGTLKVNKNLAEKAYLYVTATDTISGNSATTEIYLCPKAISGIIVKDMDGNVIESGSTVTIKEGGMFGFTVEPKNKAGEITYVDWVNWYGAFSFATSKPNVASYAVTQQGVYVMQTLEKGTTKITVKALDGSNKSFSFNVKFPNAPVVEE